MIGLDDHSPNGVIARVLYRVLPLALITSTGCYTTRNVVNIPTIDSRYPISASAEYVDQEGNTVTPSDYDVARPFRFSRTIATPRHEQSETTWRLGPTMDDIVRREQGSAVTNLRIEASNYSSGDHGSAASFKIGGWILGASGVTAIAAGAAQSDATNQSGLFTLGGIFLGAGALALLLSATAKKPASWQFTVSGQVVKSRAPVPAASNTSAQLH